MGHLHTYLLDSPCFSRPLPNPAAGDLVAAYFPPSDPLIVPIQCERHGSCGQLDLDGT
jgi:hypothetical protein